MALINLSQSNCKSCYKCVNSCGVKAIRMKDEHAQIVEERCISCGHCLVVCPQRARNIKNDVYKIKNAVYENKRVIASVAPSFSGAFNMNDSGQLVKALKLLGFNFVEETAIGAEVVAQLYKHNFEKNHYENFITTSCASMNYLIEKYYPELIEYMAPVVSPMIAHGRILKKVYGKDSFVVFIGPCISKKKEIEDLKRYNDIDAVITFEELNEWFDNENIDLTKLESQKFDIESQKDGCSFPILGGISKIIKSSKKAENYEVINVDGIDGCIEILNCIKNREINNVILEANVCKGGCIGGPMMSKNHSGYYKRQKKVKDYVESKLISVKSNRKKYYSDIDFSRSFTDKNVNKKTAPKEEIIRILRKMGKYEAEDELNCGGCGYNSCREKAQAVYEGMSDPNMCLPFLRSKAEGVSNHIIEVSPNVIFVLDENLKVKQFNPTAERTFNIKNSDIKDKPISIIMDDEKFKQVRDTKQNIIREKLYMPQYNLIMMNNVLYLDKQSSILVIMNNLTEDEKNKKKLSDVRKNTLEAAQNVIDKQMRVAQEIASLLGETTAETKLTLTKLKELAEFQDTSEKK